MKGVLFAITCLAATSGALAKGFCTGERECPMTAGVLEASKIWQSCVFDSMGVQIKHVEDLNAAAEAALAACRAEEDALFAKLEIESGFTSDETAKGRAIFRAKLKSDILDILRQGRSAQPAQ